MGQKRLGVDPELLRMCEDAGVRYAMRRKRRHIMLIVEGRSVLALPDRHASVSEGRARDNARCCLRRHLRSLDPAS